MTKKLYIIAGPNGAGKTTLAKELVKEENVSFLNADEIAKKCKDATGIKAGRMLLDKLDGLFRAGQSTVWETTVSGNLHTRIIAQARKFKYEIVFVYIFLDSVEQNLARIKQRVALGGHDVPSADVQRRYIRSLANFKDITKQVSYWELYYNGGESFELIARGTGQTVDILNERGYDNFIKRIKHDKA